MKAILAPRRIGTAPRVPRGLLRSVGTVAPVLPLFLLFFFQLGARDLVSSHEARAAQNAQRMLDTGEWGLPTLFDGQRDLQKPPGFYWLVAAAGWLADGHVSPWVARLPAATGALLAVLLVYAFLRHEGYTTGAFVAATALASANHFVAIGRTARIDVPLACTVAVSLTAFYRGTLGPRASRPLNRRASHADQSKVSDSCGTGLPACVPGNTGWKARATNAESRQSRPNRESEVDAEPLPRPELETGGRDARGPRSAPWFLLSALAAGAAVLLKGPVGLALIGCAAVAFLIVERYASPPHARPRLPFSAAVLGCAVAGGVAAPWFVWANHTTGGEFVRVFFWYHNVARFTGESDGLAAHPWWFYGPRFAMAFLPWTFALNFFTIWSFRSGAWREDRVFRFGVVWLVVMVAVLSAAQFKRADYLLPAFPGAALALGCAVERWISSRENPLSVKIAKWAFGLALAGGLAVWPVMWFSVEPAEAAKQEKRPFAAAVRAHAPAPQTVLLFRAESHLLAYHLGRPLHTLVEWGELKDTLSAPGPHVVVMPPEYVGDAEQITGRTLLPVAALADFTTVRPHRPLVCLRTAE
ncbi:glycosyltransferase family 39 protein [Frigoriglobus tundricola]|uniref:Glycosyltransferase n=1 Tax=Frigoriglobus tundricola TaxID=2774151 RepID=A0A6M5YUK5_9BACT|nr:phospholipid carrier-dependent glycosyltransferase [Frigoriglobus tundricola]QJW97765.1 glycosyltransferase [Frigoriglobus tundricola]